MYLGMLWRILSVRTKDRRKARLRAAAGWLNLNMIMIVHADAGRLRLGLSIISSLMVDGYDESNRKQKVLGYNY